MGSMEQKDGVRVEAGVGRLSLSWEVYYGVIKAFSEWSNSSYWIRVIINRPVCAVINALHPVIISANETPAAIFGVSPLMPLLFQTHHGLDLHRFALSTLNTVHMQSSTDGVGHIFLRVPFWEAGRTWSAVLFLGWEKRSMKRGCGAGTSSPQQERWRHWCLVTAPWEVTHYHSQVSFLVFTTWHLSFPHVNWSISESWC